MNISMLMWLVSAVFIIHDFEEIITVEMWLKNNEKDLLAVIPARFHNYFYKVFPKSTSGFACAVLVEYIGILVCTCISVFNHFQGSSNIGIVAVVSILFLHSFTHIGQAVLLRRYTPGVLTTVLVLIPFSIYFFNFVLSNGIVHWNLIYLSVPLGVVLVATLNQFGLWLGKRVVF